MYNLPALVGRFPQALESIRHRGPDAHGTYHAARPEGTVLGSRRLSILDPTSAADQPFSSGGLHLVYNGEIYNFRDIRSQLESGGVVFSTSSDTEVLIEAWRAWGPGCLPKLRGMFAFAIYDESTSSLFLVRDPFGIKPLFYSRQGDGLAFASEIKGLRALVPKTDIDYSGVGASLMYHWLPESRSVFKGVDKLAPGHWAEIRPDGRMTTTVFWDPRVELVSDPGPEPSTAQLRATIEESVKAHMISDAPVAMFLSGGLDSSLIAGIASDIDPDIEAYTIAFRAEDRPFEAMPDDAAYARKVAAHNNITLHEIEVAPDLVDMLPRMIEILDEPIGDPAAINTLLICEASRRAGVKVMLSGMGADELFGGYRKHLASMLAGRYRQLPLAARRHLIEPAVRRMPVAGSRRGYRYSRWSKRFTEFANLDEQAAFQRSYTLFSDSDLTALVSPDLAGAVDDLLDEHEAIYWDGPGDDQINRMCYTDTQLFLTGLNLAYTDRASMAASTEVRVPFVDREVAHAAFAIPGSRKIVGRRSKVALKQAAEPWVPSEVINRPKGLFSVPLRAWIRGDLKPIVDEVVLDGELIRSGILDGDLVAGIVDRDRRGVEDNAKQVWQLLTLELWYDAATRPTEAIRR
jgi:asparagine synthase (glutamine-hydrolysing)